MDVLLRDSGSVWSFRDMLVTVLGEKAELQSPESKIVFVDWLRP